MAKTTQPSLAERLDQIIQYDLSQERLDLTKCPEELRQFITQYIPNFAHLNEHQGYLLTEALLDMFKKYVAQRSSMIRPDKQLTLWVPGLVVILQYLKTEEKAKRERRDVLDLLQSREVLEENLPVTVPSRKAVLDEIRVWASQSYNQQGVKSARYNRQRKYGLELLTEAILQAVNAEKIQQTGTWIFSPHIAEL